MKEIGGAASGSIEKVGINLSGVGSGLYYYTCRAGRGKNLPNSLRYLGGVGDVLSGAILAPGCDV